ncbi:uncharacterized protein [Venturia canescens]|uniref:uncharacterized protein n=1 Tax=Venturia canescens TaxID=32260 RepID=UPI001C9BE0F8|nr:uncharacterized protein LOC122409773 [Venturia canescens]
MSVNPLTWKSRNFLYFILGLISFYALFIHKRKHNVSFEATIRNSKPVTVWEFVADFSNMKKLNPTIEDFNIIAESGDLDHWKYSVKYTEHLSHVPSVRNTAHGHYSVRPEGDGFLISSEHRTCFYSTFDCVDSLSEFRFNSMGKDTKCQEIVQYECPIIFSMLCHKEVMFQRREIMKRLEQHFTMSNSIEKDDAEN